MKWNFKMCPDNISAYKLTSSEGHELEFKYSQLQQSIRMKFNNHRVVYLLDQHFLAGRKFAIRNVYGSEIGSFHKSFLSDLSGNLVFDENNKMHFKILPASQAIELHNKTFTAYCQLDEQWQKSHEEIYLLALIALSWLYAVAPVQPMQVHSQSALTGVYR